MATAVNDQFDRGQDDLSAKLVDIVAHRYISGILDLQIKYTTGGYSWHPLDLIKDENPQVVTKYGICTDPGKVSNGQHCR